MDQKTQTGVRTWFIKHIAFILIFGAVLFISAGRLNWLGGWAYLAAMAISMIANALTLKPDLLAERSTRQEGSKNWDLVLATFVALGGPILTLITGGIDVRDAWSPPLMPLIGIVAWVIGILGVLLTVWAMAANEFFSGLVRVQADRRHTVATGGPYRYVRHPGYVGAIVFDLTVPFFLGSLYAFVPAGLTVLAIIVRTALEDTTLHAELGGYQDYAQRVRYRLLPGIW
ncbi:MAG: isoprenylcysteine carboxylmethyltransferase family protein [Anaerolineae bacterium]|nr:isoprenylcysteine carboxylmethyltransferase family protein [Anaerolineae bacterium]